MIKKSVAIICLIVITLITAILSSCVTRYFDKKAYVKNIKVDVKNEDKTSNKDEKLDILPNDKENSNKNTTEMQINEKKILEVIGENQDAIKQDQKTSIQPSSNNVLVSVEIIKTVETAFGVIEDFICYGQCVMMQAVTRSRSRSRSWCRSGRRRRIHVTVTRRQHKYHQGQGVKNFFHNECGLSVKTYS